MKFIGSIFLVLILFFIIQINWKLYYTPSSQRIEGGYVNEDLLLELRSLRSSMEAGAAVDMQKLFPEGYLFMNALYGLSWCEMAGMSQQSSDLYTEAHREVQRSYESVNSDAGRIIFDESLPLSYGAFYNGWNNYFLAKKVAIEKEENRNEDEIVAFKLRCEQISESIQDKIYPASYYRGAWPADVLACVASLALHDRMFSPKYGGVIQEWLQRVKNNLDENGLIPHSVHPASGKKLESARGSSQSLMLIFLYDIDKIFAREQFDIYKKLFLDFRLGLPGIREYPKGKSGLGDVDSGPVILGMGGAATIVGIQTLYLYGETSTALLMRNGIEGFGLTTTFFGKKRYLFGLMPMADAFITWSHTKINLPEEEIDAEFSGRNQFHLYSLVPVMLIFLLLAFSWRSKWKKTIS